MERSLTGPEGTYVLLNEIAQGGFGVTYRARREEDGAEVVVKKLRIERLKDWKSLELFEREAKVLRALNHANIPAYIDAFSVGPDDAPEGYVLVQGYVPGPTLSQVMRGDARRLSNQQMLSWFFELLEICEYLHGRHPPIVHRDISPKNIILRSTDDAAVLIDFGTVQARIRSASEVASTSAGTFGYAPMEQFVGRATPSSDLYSAAMTFIAVASGLEPEAMPFSGNRVEVQEALPGFEPRLQLVLKEMTEPNPDDRPQSASEVLALLQSLRVSEVHAEPEAAKVPRAPTETGRQLSASSAPTPSVQTEATERWRMAQRRLA